MEIVLTGSIAFDYLMKPVDMDQIITKVKKAAKKKRQHEKPTVFLVDSDGGDPDLAQKGAVLRAQYCEAGIPAYPSVRRAAKALFHLYRYYDRRMA